MRTLGLLKHLTTYMQGLKKLEQHLKIDLKREYV